MKDPAHTRNTPFTQLFDLRGQVALVTGAARGLGRGIAERLGECGATVVVADANAALGAATTADLAARGVTAAFFHADLMHEDAIVRLVREVGAAHGRIDILVNNAGIYPYSPLMDMSTAQLDAVLGLDLRAPFLLCREVARAMISASVPGRIVNVSSINAFRSPFAGVASSPR